MNYKHFEIYRNFNGQYEIYSDTPDGLLPCSKRTECIESAKLLIDNF